MASNANPLITVYTCVYNMSDKIHRACDSVKSQTYKNIEHVIVNDGSTDDVESVLEAYKSSVEYPVIIINKENGGKHTALNAAWDNANGEYLIQVDADDELYPNAIDFLLNVFLSIPEERRKDFWCVQGRCRTQKGDFVGDRYPDNINELPVKEKKYIAAHTKGDKIALQKKSALENMRYPTPKYVRHVLEGTVWKPLNEKYETWYTNEVVHIYYVGEGGSLSSNEFSRERMTTVCYASKWQILNKKYFPENRIKYYASYAGAYQTAPDYFKKEYGFFEGFGLWQVCALIPFFILRPLLGCKMKKR